MQKGTALIVGVTGVSGHNLARVLVAEGWTVYGLARQPGAQEGVIAVAADLLDADSVHTALRGLPITHVFFCTWTRRATEKENIEANGSMMRNLYDGLATWVFRATTTAARLFWNSSPPCAPSGSFRKRVSEQGRHG